MQLCSICRREGWAYLQQEGQLFLLLVQAHAGGSPFLLDVRELGLQGGLGPAVRREQQLLARLHSQDVAALLSQEHFLLELEGSIAVYFLILSFIGSLFQVSFNDPGFLRTQHALFIL